MPLVIVESPAKCAKIKGFLGSSYDVIASMGHIRGLVQELNSVGIDRDFEPSFEFMKEKSKAINAIKDMAKKHKDILLAADADREGEMIAYSVCLLLRLDPTTTPRITFTEITEKAVKDAVAHPKRLDMNKIYAQQSRAVLDMLVGFTISPLLWKYVGQGLSAGRCQTPALRLVKDKEKSIESFSSAQSWKVEGQWGSLHAFLTDELEDEESAQNYLEALIGKTKGRILTNTTRPTSQQPPNPLITSSLQQQASTFLRTNPKMTMSIAQRLYEGGHITYMRTDKAVLSDDAKKDGSEYILKRFGEEYLNATMTAKPITTTKKASMKSKTTKDTVLPAAQEAHEAIRPTHIDQLDLPVHEDWSANDRKLYKLIWTRTLQSLMAPTEGEHRSIDFRAEGDDEEWTWRINLSRTTFNGWRVLDWKDISEDTLEETAEQWKLSSSLKPGTILEWNTLYAQPHFTKAPARYTEATLIKDLEENGIGRPSTFASLISTILDKGYVEKKSFEGREASVHVLNLTSPSSTSLLIETKTIKLGAEKDRLVPTSLGLSVLNYLLQHFQNLFAYDFTSSMEKRLDSIAEGNEFWKEVLRDTWKSYKDIYESQKTTTSTTNISDESDRRRELGESLVAITTKKGPLLLKEDPEKNKDKTIFYGWPPKVAFQDITLEVAKEFIMVESIKKQGRVLGEIEEHPVVIKSGPYGFYAEWNEKRVSCEENTTLEELEEKFQNLTTNILRRIGEFEFRNGPYGVYMFKTTAKKKEFVSVPRNLVETLEDLTEGGCVALFQHGLQLKAKAKVSGRGRGGFRFRGRGRGH